MLNIYHLLGPNLVPKVKMLRIYWNLAHLIFQITWSQNFNVKDNFYEMFPTCLAQIGPKTRNTQNLLKFGTSHIWNIPISILMSKIIFIKYLPPVRPKLVLVSKVLRIYWNLAYSIFQICQSQLWCEKWFLSNIYHLLDPNLFQN